MRENGSGLQSEVKVSSEQANAPVVAQDSSALAGTNAASSKERTPRKRNRRFIATWVNILISICALCVSGWAVWVAIDSARATREHNKLSVRSHISLSFYANDKGAGVLRTVSGLGPAIINSFDVTVDGKQVNTWEQVLKALGIPEIMYHPQSGWFDKGPLRGPATWGKGLKAL